MAESLADKRAAEIRSSHVNSKPAGVKKDRERRQYDHEMSDKERFALQVVLKAKAACAQIAIAIQEGKGITPEAYQAALSLQASAGAMLFG